MAQLACNFTTAQRAKRSKHFQGGESNEKVAHHVAIIRGKKKFLAKKWRSSDFVGLAMKSFFFLRVISVMIMKGLAPFSIFQEVATEEPQNVTVERRFFSGVGPHVR